MTEPVGIGLVGAGAYGEFCLAAFAEVPEVRIAAICDTDKARAKRFALQYSVPAYTSLDALLEDATVEIVALNTPPFLHARQGLAALEAGKHLFCEKPLALTLPEGEALANAAQRAGTRLTVDYVMRQNPLWTAAANIAASGVLGKLLHMDLANHAAGLSLPSNGFGINAKAAASGLNTASTFLMPSPGSQALPGTSPHPRHSLIAPGTPIASKRWQRTVKPWRIFIMASHKPAHPNKLPPA